MSHIRAAHIDDDAPLRREGITPTLARRMNAFGNGAISATVICVLAGCMTMFGYGMVHGGPIVMVWGWVAIFAMTLIVGSCLAEVTSVYPTAGAMYHMANRLGGRGWAWTTGWLNLLGLLGAIAGIDYGAATFIGAFASLQWGFEPTPTNVLPIFAGVLVLHALLNSFGVRLVDVLNKISVWWQVFGVLLIVGLLVLAPGERQSVSFVFTHYYNGSGFVLPGLVAALGCGMAMYTFCGYDASAHMAEETTRAQRSVPRGMVHAILWSGVAGFVLIVGLLFAMEDYAGTLNTATGVPPAQIFDDVLGAGVAKALLLVVIVAQLFCGNAEVAATSRMIYAFSRNRALPGWRIWSRADAKNPTAAVWLAVGLALVLTLPVLLSPTAYFAITAINVVGITPSYAIPIYLKLRAGDRFQPGPWNLGRFSKPLGWIAVAYVAVLVVVICLPQTSPITPTTFNYAPITLAAALLFAGITWMTTGRKHYAMPVPVSTAKDSAIAGGMV
ncbi:amino acid permease [Streptomyces tauricus]|uniref:Amino acid permease n=1 Tax=Streptomyces tauricus TaxID=68274 RepID=A0ABZ1JTH6_9ACTN|nr:amino acid permease [Streptomyces tauricus]